MGISLLWPSSTYWQKRRGYARGFRPGFTLVELLVVIGILTVVIGMLLPTIAASVANARALQCQSNVRVICQQLIGYASLSRGRFPANTITSTNSYWYQATAISQLTPNPQNELQGPVATCPDDPDAKRSYAMNLWCSSKIDAGTQNGNASLHAWAFNGKGASEIMLVSEAWSSTGSAITGWLSAPTIGSYGSTPGQRFGGRGGVSYPGGRFGITQSELDFSRHRLVGRSRPRSEAVGRVVVGYADGHVMLKSNTELVTPIGTSTLNTLWTPSDRTTNR